MKILGYSADRFAVCAAFLVSIVLITPALAVDETDASLARHLQGLDALEQQGAYVSPDIVRQLRNGNDAANTALVDAVTLHADSNVELRLEGELVVGSNASGSLVFTPAASLEPGASILIGRHWMDPSHLQIENPDAADFVSLQSLPQADFAVDYTPHSGLFGGLEAPAHAIVFELISGRVAAGQSVRFKLSGLNLPVQARQTYSLGVAIRTSARAPYVPVRSNSVQLKPAGLERISLQAQSLASPGETVQLSLRMEDRYGNLVSGRNLSLDLMVNGVFRQRIDAVSAVENIPGVSFSQSGVYLLEARSAGGGLRALANPVLVGDSAAKIVWADIGSTTLRSDGIWSESELRQQRAGRYELVIPLDHGEFMLAPTADVTADVQRSSPHADISSLSKVSHGNSGHREQDIWVVDPESMSDIRKLTPSVSVLALVAAGRSSYGWFAERVANAGYKTAVAGTNHSHQYPDAAKPVYTAIMVDDRNEWFEALGQRRSYVSVGEKVLVLGIPDTLIAGEIPDFEITATAATPVLGIQVFKNGEPFRRTAPPPSDPARITLGVDSSSEPYGRFADKARNAREWIGFVLANGAELRVRDVPEYWDVQQGSDLSRLDFYTRTHGRQHQLDIEVIDAAPDTVFELNLAAGFEDAAWLPGDRLPAETAAARFMISQDEVQSGARRTTMNNGYLDTLLLTNSTGSSSTQMRLAVSGGAPAKAGDYYQIKVELDNGNYALSSPIHVGDF